MRLRPLAFATFLVWRLRIGACGVGACSFEAYDSYPPCASLHAATERQSQEIKYSASSPIFVFFGCRLAPTATRRIKSSCGSTLVWPKWPSWLAIPIGSSTWPWRQTARRSSPAQETKLSGSGMCSASLVVRRYVCKRLKVALVLKL